MRIVKTGSGPRGKALLLSGLFVLEAIVGPGASRSADTGREEKGDSLKGGEMVFVEGFGFYLDKYEVTVAQYLEFLNAVGNRLEGGAMWLETESKFAHIEMEDGRFVPREDFANHPAVEVSWYGARAYCSWAGKRLPTETEWQQACEGKAALSYPWGDTFEEGRANIFGTGDGYGRTAPVGSFPAGTSPCGAMDMAGNVWEWTAATAGGGRFVHGGSWVNGKTMVRCGVRVNTESAHTYIMGNSMGFRCAR